MRVRCLFLFCLASAILSLGNAVILVAQESPKAPDAHVFTLTPTPGYFTEPSIAVNPKNPEQVVGTFQDNVHASYSTDSGATWQVEDIAPKNYRVSGDVSV